MRSSVVEQRQRGGGARRVLAQRRVRGRARAGARDARGRHASARAPRCSSVPAAPAGRCCRWPSPLSSLALAFPRCFIAWRTFCVHTRLCQADTRVSDVRITDDIKDSTTLGALGVRGSRAEAISTYLRNNWNVHLEENGIRNLTIARLEKRHHI